MIIHPTGGLCNYLRVIFSYYEYAKSLHQKLYVIWDITKACNGHFLDYFEPVSNIVFIKNKNNNNIYYKGCYICPKFSPNYTYIKLLPHMKNIIDKKINILNNNYISVHIRRTDHINLAKKNNKYTTDQDFITFLDLYKKYNIYIATDNKETYTTFKKKYNNSIKCDYHKTNNSNLRKTSLQDAIVDIYMCVHSKYFMGSGWSSFSGFINALRNK